MIEKMKIGRKKGRILFDERKAGNEKLINVLDNINAVMVGKEEVALLSLVALLAEGHVLLEDVPGVGKTMLIRTLAKSIDGEFKRIQFTPDLLPSDVTGVSVYNPKTLDFEFHKGPIFGNVILADEINRTSPKTQSSLLEAMEESSVTIDGQTSRLNRPFFVMATQNPIEHEGTYPLPEAQLDRFLLKLKIGYPDPDAELLMLERQSRTSPLHEIGSVITREELLFMQEEARDVHAEKSVLNYIVSIAQATREHPSIALGISPRASLALMRAAKAYAYIHGRSYVVPDDIKHLAPYVLSHRIILTPEARYAGEQVEGMLDQILNGVSIPISKGIPS